MYDLRVLLCKYYRTTISVILCWSFYLFFLTTRFSSYIKRNNTDLHWAWNRSLLRARFIIALPRFTSSVFSANETNVLTEYAKSHEGEIFVRYENTHFRCTAFVITRVRKRLFQTIFRATDRIFSPRRTPCSRTDKCTRCKYIVSNKRYAYETTANAVRTQRIKHLEEVPQLH
jgi:hypothetical protein